jgi:4a-hydroxytetrahydrobiopterin dehydratase
MTVASDGLSVRLTRGFSLEARDADLARALSATAREHGAVDPLGHGSTFWMQELDPDKALRHAMHIDVSVAREEVEARVAAAVSAGGRIVKDADAPAAWILADPAGNRVCIAAWPDGSVSPPS